MKIKGSRGENVDNFANVLSAWAQGVTPEEADADEIVRRVRSFSTHVVHFLTQGDSRSHTL